MSNEKPYQVMSSDTEAAEKIMSDAQKEGSANRAEIIGGINEKVLLEFDNSYELMEKENTVEHSFMANGHKVILESPYDIDHDDITGEHFRYGEIDGVTIETRKQLDRILDIYLPLIKARLETQKLNKEVGNKLADERFIERLKKQERLVDEALGVPSMEQ